MRFVRGFVRFWVDFIVGDDWKIAVAVACALVVGAVVVAASDTRWIAPVVAGAVAVAFVTALAVDVRRA